MESAVDVERTFLKSGKTSKKYNNHSSWTSTGSVETETIRSPIRMLSTLVVICCGLDAATMLTLAASQRQGSIVQEACSCLASREKLRWRLRSQVDGKRDN